MASDSSDTPVETQQVEEHAREWVNKLAPFIVPDDRRGWVEVCLTLTIFIVVWVAAYWLVTISFWLALPMLFLGGAMMVRLFICQHDCGHHSLFSSKKTNGWVGRSLGVITLTPFDYWRRMHATHHAGSGNLDLRGTGDIDTLTITEYKALSPASRLAYRIYRNPVVLFIFGPSYMFLLRHRWPTSVIRLGTKSVMSVLGTNLSIALTFYVLISLVGLKAFLLVHIPMIAVGSSIGVWMFYIQHQFEHTNWEEPADWSHPFSALHGSSYYDLPKPIMWMTGYIGIHHVHHLSSRIAFHKLPKVLESFPELKTIGRMTFLESLACIRLALWDSKQKKLVSFSAA